MHSTLFQGKEADEEASTELQTGDGTSEFDEISETADYKEYVIMKERNDRLEDEIQWLVMRSNVGADDPVKKVSIFL